MTTHPNFCSPSHWSRGGMRHHSPETTMIRIIYAWVQGEKCWKVWAGLCSLSVRRNKKKVSKLWHNLPFQGLNKYMWEVRAPSFSKCMMQLPNRVQRQSDCDFSTCCPKLSFRISWKYHIVQSGNPWLLRESTLGLWTILCYSSSRSQASGK